MGVSLGLQTYKLYKHIRTHDYIRGRVNLLINAFSEATTFEVCLILSCMKHCAKPNVKFLPFKLKRDCRSHTKLSRLAKFTPPFFDV